MPVNVARAVFRMPPVVAAYGTVLLLAGCTSIDAQPVIAQQSPSSLALPAERPSLAEIAYVEQTASVVYRRAPVERMDRFLFSDERGHGVCVRSPAGQPETADYTLLVLQRRLQSDFISQVEDDVVILRSAADAAPCRTLGSERALWTRSN